MAEVDTVTGPLEARALGKILVHEHVLNSSPGTWRAWPDLFGGVKGFFERAERVFADVREQGEITTIVDLTPRDLGREVEVLLMLARRTGVNIICATGLYGRPDLTAESRTVDELAKFFRKELEIGIDETAIRAGVIKCAVPDAGPTAFHERTWRAAARAHCETGVPISLHSNAPNRLGRIQLDVLEAEGVAPQRVSVGHCDDVDNYDDADFDYITELADRGCWIAFDRYPGGPRGVHFSRNWEERVDFLARIVNAGYGDHVLLSHDYSIGLTLFDSEFVQRYDAAYPDRLLFIQRHVLPRLGDLGVSPQFLNGALSRNPQTFLNPGR